MLKSLACCLAAVAGICLEGGLIQAADTGNNWPAWRGPLANVLRKGPKLEVLARNKLDDKTDASIALAGSDLFIRGHKLL